MRQIRKLGSMGEIMKMIPGMGRVVEAMGNVNADDEIRRVEGMINSMTAFERNNPDQIDRSRRNRIAKGSGVQPHDINKLLKDFTTMSRMMQDMSNMGMKDRFSAVRQMASGGFLNPGTDLRDVRIRPQKSAAELSDLREKKKKQRKDAKKQKKRNRRK